MFPSVLWICYLWLQINVLLSVDASSSPTLRFVDPKDLIESNTPAEGFFVIVDKRRQNSYEGYHIATSECNEAYNHTGVEVTMLKSLEYLKQLASQDDDFCYDKKEHTKNCGKYLTQGRCDSETELMFNQCRFTCRLCPRSNIGAHTYLIGLNEIGEISGRDRRKGKRGVWTWADGSVLDIQNDIWEQNPPKNGYKCAHWQPGLDDTNAGKINVRSCMYRPIRSLCQITDKNECSSSPCPHDATCENTVGSYKCVCQDGYKYEESGNKCIDIDECASSPCPSDATCTNSVGSYECVCPTGHKYNIDSNECVDIDECLGNPCHTEATCTNKKGSYSCACKDDLVGDGVSTCEECRNDQGKLCLKNSCKVNSGKGYTCGCPDGYIGDGITLCAIIDEDNERTKDEAEEYCKSKKMTLLRSEASTRWFIPYTEKRLTQALDNCHYTLLTESQQVHSEFIDHFNYWTGATEDVNGNWIWQDGTQLGSDFKNSMNRGDNFYNLRAFQDTDFDGKCARFNAITGVTYRGECATEKSRTICQL